MVIVQDNTMPPMVCDHSPKTYQYKGIHWRQEPVSKLSRAIHGPHAYSCVVRVI